MHRLQESTGTSARSRPDRPGLAEFARVVNSLGTALCSPQTPHGLFSGKAPARMPARGLAGIVRSIYGDSAQIRQNQQQSLVGDAGSMPGARLQLCTSVIHLLLLEGFVGIGHARDLRQSMSLRLQCSSLM